MSLLQLQSLLGLISFPLIAWVLSENRGAYSSGRFFRLVVGAVLLQIGIAAAMLYVPALQGGGEWITILVKVLNDSMLAGMKFVFGYVAGGPAPFDVTKGHNGFILAFQALPLILITSALTKLLYHWGVLQLIVRAFSWVLQRSLGISGVIGISSAANIFVGMVEAPLFVRPYLMKLSRGGLFVVMSVGMATIAGTVLVLYATVLAQTLPGAAGHLVVASLISAPAAIMLAYLMVPGDDEDGKEGRIEDNEELKSYSSVDAIVKGTQEGVHILVNVTALLVVLTALVYLANQILGSVSGLFGVQLSVQMLLGYLFAPLAWLTGVPWSESIAAGSLLGTKTVLNEFLAYLQMSQMPAEALSDRSRLIMSYALCGFANLASLGVMIGGFLAMLPERKQEIIELSTKTLISGTLATLMTGSVIGVLS